MSREKLVCPTRKSTSDSSYVNLGQEFVIDTAGLPDRLNKLLAKKNLSKADLSRAMGKENQGAITGWFKKSMPRGDQLCFLAHVLDVGMGAGNTMEYLMTGKPDPEIFLAKTESSALNSKVETSWPEQLGDGVKQILVLLENMTGYIRGLEKRLETIERGCMFAQEKDGLRELVKMVIEEKEKRSGNTKVSEE